jgi:hypothetical protein
VIASSPPVKFGLFFGAGAEIAYGLPSGGRFALEIFRRGADAEKDLIRHQIKSVDKSDVYASTFLPHDFETKRISKFGKADYKAILKSSIEQRRSLILQFFDNFDQHVASKLQRFERLTGKVYGSVTYDHEVKLHDSLRSNTKLFKSPAFSAMLQVLRQKKATEMLRRCLTSFLKLLVGCYAQNMCSELNEQTFTKAPDGISIFDDLGGLFQVEMSQAGLSALEIVLEDTATEIDGSSSSEVVFEELARRVLELLIEGCLDYQSLIDENFRFLYQPKAHWGNFTKIVTFLHVVRAYLVEQAEKAGDSVTTGPGFYHDLKVLGADGVVPHVIGTSNYNSLAEQIIGSICPVEHLHGSVSEFYDPYGNSIVNVLPGEDMPEGRILVPLLFTQSGIKPLTSLEMSRRYVELYDRFCDSDAVVVCGYGFNGDDGHINCLFRNLIEVDKKDVFILDYVRDGKPKPGINATYSRKLRLRAPSPHLHVISVGPNRMTQSGEMWHTVIAERVRTMPSRVGFAAAKAVSTSTAH